MDLSIIIPVYNAAATVGAALDSVFLPDHAGLSVEVIAVNDGSVDESGAVLQEYREKYPQALCVIDRENRGVGATRTEGFSAARGKYVTYLDSDDLLAEAYFRELAPLILSGAWDAVLFDALFLSPDGETEPFEALSRGEGVLTKREAILSFPAPWNKILKKELLETANFAFPEKIWYEDLATIPALFAAAERIFYRKKALYFYRQTPSSITRGEGYCEKWLDILPALALLEERLGEGFRVEAEYLAYLHLYRTFAWKFLAFEKWRELEEIRKFMKAHFPHFLKNELVRKENRKERMTAFLFFHKGARILANYQKRGKKQ